MISAKVKNGCCRRNIYLAMTLSLPPVPDFRNGGVREYYGALKSELYPDGAPSRESLGDMSSSSHLHCAACKGALLRGLFLAVGSVNPPEKHEYNLDFTFREEASMENAARLLESSGFEPRRRLRRGAHVLYFKSSDTIGAFFAAAGSNRVMFDIINAHMEADITGALNRANNTDISNITKSTAASERACEAIRFLIASERINMLDDTLYKTAMLRVENPELSLFQLAAASPEGVSKSTLNARLRRIIEFADKYRK